MKLTAHNILFSFFVLLSGTSAFLQYSSDEQKQIDSLKKIVEASNQDSIKLNALIAWDNIIYAYDPELDIELNKQIIDISNQGLTRGNLTSREIELYLGAKGMACNNMGLVQVDYGNYKEALENFQFSLQIGEYFQDSVKQGNALNNIGMIYKHLHQPSKALSFYEKSMNYSMKDAYAYGTYYNNIGICYFEMNEPDKALECYKKSLVYADSCKDYGGKGNTLANIGLIFIKQQQFDSAIFYLDYAIETYQIVDDKNGLAFANKNIGDSYFELGDYQRSLEYCKKAYQLADESKSLLAQKESCLCLYKSNKKLGKINDALHFHEQFIVIKDSLESTAKNEEILQLDFEFNLERQRLHDSLQFANENHLQQVKYESTLEKKQITQYILFAGIGISLFIGVLMFRGYLRKKRDHEIIAIQKNEVETQKHIVEEKNKEITDSINYAKRIQQAILPSNEILADTFNSSFVIYLPKDIVAGDFYWLERNQSYVFFAVADCTGHGVPGAIVSVVCHNALNRAVNEFKLTDPGNILDKTRELVVQTFEKENYQKTKDTIRDGMDISLCVFDREKNKLYYSGANNALYLIRKNNLTEFNPDKQPIGRYADEKPFNTHTIDLQSGDLVYLYTDGFADQFGGPDGKKFKYKQLKELLINNANLSLADQAAVLKDKFEKWKGNLEQVDDVCLMGIKF